MRRHLKRISRIRFTPPSFEKDMKWADLKVPYDCLPEAIARGEAALTSEKAKPIERWGRKATGLKSSHF